MSTIIEIPRTCQTCIMPHGFKKNNTRGLCTFLSKTAKKTIFITRSTVCRFHQIDTRQKSVVLAYVNTPTDFGEDITENIIDDITDDVVENK